MTLNIILTIILIAVVLYFLIFMYQRISNRKAQELKDKKDQLASMKVREELLEGRKMALSGQTLKQYQQLEADYNDLENNKFLKIDNQANVVSFESRGINVIRTRNEIARLEDQVKEAETILNQTRDGLKKLKELDEEHKAAVAALVDRYDQIEKKIQEDFEKLGPSVPALQENLDRLREKYQTFANYTNEGDHDKATNIYEQLKVETSDLEKLMAEIPDIQEKLNVKYPEQIEELEAGAKDLTRQGYVFTSDPNATIADIERQRQEISEKLGELKIKDAQNQLGYIERQIDQLYEMMEKEISSKEVVKDNQIEIVDLIEKVRQQNQALTIELDRLSQKFELRENEIENVRAFGEQIKTIDDANKAVQKNLRSRITSFSVAEEKQKEAIDNLQQIGKDQQELWNKISTYDSLLFDAKNEWQEMTNKVAELRKSIERQNLPGLPVDYRLKYQSVNEMINQLGESLSQLKVDLDEVARELNVARQDLENLKEQSNNVLDQAEITEDLMRYANRYRNDPRVIAGMEQAKLVYDRDFDFQRAETLVGQALNQVETGAWEAIRDQHFRRTKRVL